MRTAPVRIPRAQAHCGPIVDTVEIIETREINETGEIIETREINETGEINETAETNDQPWRPNIY